MIKLGFKKLHPDAKIPVKAHAGDAGMDICSIEDLVELEALHPMIIKTGLAVDIPEGYELQVRSRSGLAAKGIVVANSPGTIDSGYKGEIGVILTWIHQPHTVMGTLICPKCRISKGDRIAQLVLAPVIPCETCEVDDIGSSDRGTGGFGSTGL